MLVRLVQRRNQLVYGPLLPRLRPLRLTLARSGRCRCWLSGFIILRWVTSRCVVENLDTVRDQLL